MNATDEKILANASLRNVMLKLIKLCLKHSKEQIKPINVLTSIEYFI